MRNRSMARSMAVILCLSILSACDAKLTMDTVKEEPSFTGIVTEVYETSILVTSEDTQVGTLVNVTLQPELADSYTSVSVGDEITVYYNGQVMESYPTQLGKVFAITLLESVATYCDRIVMNEATQADFERCGAEKILTYDEKFYEDAMSGGAKYSINHFDDEHLLEVTKLVYHDIWSWYTTKANSSWRYMEFDHRVQAVKMNGKPMFTIVSNTTDIFAKYFLFAVRFDEETNTFVLRKVNERNENNVTEALLTLLQNRDTIVNIEKDFTSYRKNELGEMIPNVEPYDDYTLLEGDSIETRLNKIHSFVVNHEACNLYSAVNYCDVDSYYYHYDEELTHILVNVSTLESNMAYYYSLDDGKPTFHLGEFDYRLPRDGETITFETMRGKRQLTRDGSNLFDKAQ